MVREFWPKSFYLCRFEFLFEFTGFYQNQPATASVVERYGKIS
jgi:hypothetical protein